MPIAINERCIPATFEEAQHAYEEGKDVVLSFDGKRGEAISKKFRTQKMNIEDWSLMMKAKWFISSYPCMCEDAESSYPVVKFNSQRIYEICPTCNGTIQTRKRENGDEIPAI